MLDFCKMYEFESQVEIIAFNLPKKGKIRTFFKENTNKNNHCLLLVLALTRNLYANCILSLKDSIKEKKLPGIGYSNNISYNLISLIVFYDKFHTIQNFICTFAAANQNLT